MRIGVVSDTHNNLKNVRRIVELFNGSGIEHVIHTGDITQAKTIDAFANLEMPMSGVFGNNDVERETLLPAIARCGFQFFEPPFKIRWHGREIIVVHDPLEFEGHLAPEYDLALHGHTHRYRLESVDSTLVFNPGESAGHMQGYNAIGIVDLNSLSTEIINF